MTTKEKFYKAINIIADKKDKDLICIKACEELSKLQTKLLQYVNKKSVKDEDIAEEVAYVLFNCEILRIVFNVDEKVIDKKANKFFVSDSYMKYVEGK